MPRNKIPAAVAYHVFDANTRTWLCDDGTWSSSFFDSADFYDFDEAKQTALAHDSRDPTANVRVLASMPLSAGDV